MNTNKKKIFACSDEHGFYDELILSLQEAGFDEANPNHLLISCGDNFDRGPKSKEIFEYYYRLAKEGKAIILQGNHDEFFTEFLDGPVSNFNYLNNGLRTTIDSFLGTSQAFFSWVEFDKELEQQTLTNVEWNTLWYEWQSLAREEIKKAYPELRTWIENLRPYYETKNYIFTHGSIQTTLNWREPTNGWNWHHWDKGQFINEQVYNTDKKIVLGHFYSAHLREMHRLGDPNDNSILISPDKQKIFIDGCVPLTKKVNVLVLEDDLIE